MNVFSLDDTHMVWPPKVQPLVVDPYGGAVFNTSIAISSGPILELLRRSEINPHPVGSTIPRECPECDDGSGRVDYTVDMHDAFYCHHCTNGEQQFKVESVSLGRVPDITTDKVKAIQLYAMIGDKHMDSWLCIGKGAILK